MSDFMTMTAIGEPLGYTSHQIGYALRIAGLRTRENKPSSLAFELGLVEPQYDDFGHYLWAWHEERVLPYVYGAKMVPKRPPIPRNDDQDQSTAC